MDTLSLSDRTEEAMMAREARLASVFCLGASIILGTTLRARANVVTDWNQTALRANETAGISVPVQARTMAMVHAAMFDAVNDIEHKYAVYAIDVRPARKVSAKAAAAAAAHGILERLYPPQKAMLDAALANSLSRIPDGPAKLNGLQLGREVADRLFALRENDGSAAQQSYSFGTGAGVYQATPPMNANPILPQWRNVKPFVMTSAKQFAFAGPPAPPSAAFAKDFNEVKRLGSQEITARTTEQTAIAIRWARSEIPPLNAIAREAAAAKGLRLVDTARLFVS